MGKSKLSDFIPKAKLSKLAKQYKDIDLKKIEEEIAKMFWKDTPVITYEELRAKILPGYMYSIDSKEDPDSNVRATRIRAGQGGILLYLDECEKTGWPAGFYQKSITVWIDNQPYTLDQVNTKKNEQVQ